jgi:hypothetical protein
VNADSAAPDEASRLLARAAEVLRQHLPDADGWCVGCVLLWGRLVFYEQCTQAQWARAVRLAYRSQLQDRSDQSGRQT